MRSDQRSLFGLAEHLPSRPLPPFPLTSEGNFVEEAWRPVVGAIVAQLNTRKSLDRGQMIGIYLQRGAICRQRFVDEAGALEGQGKIHPGVGVAGHELAGPFKLVGGFVELALRKIEDAEIVVGRAVIEIGTQRFAQPSLGFFRIGVD